MADSGFNNLCGGQRPIAKTLGSKATFSRGETYCFGSRQCWIGSLPCRKDSKEFKVIVHCIIKTMQDQLKDIW